MPKMISLKTHEDSRGCLAVVDKVLPFKVERLYYIFKASGIRGGHRHHRSIQALICVHGSCDIFIQTKDEDQVIPLDNPSKCLILNPEDWHTMENFTSDAVLLVLSSTSYDVNDYIDEPYRPVHKPLVRGSFRK